MPCQNTYKFKDRKTFFVLNQININVKFTVNALFLVTSKVADNLDYNIVLLKLSWSTGLPEKLPQHEVAATFYV